MRRRVLTEGVHDPGIFKAIFLAGGPGSGKSTVVRKMIFPERYGLKLVNVDTLYEMFLKGSGAGMDMSDDTPKIRKARMKAFNRARSLTKKQRETFIDGRLGLVIDGTGGSFGAIRNQKKRLEDLGYDAFMVYVDTELDTAIDRNIRRGEAGGRRLRDKDLMRSWKAVNKNKELHEELFGDNIVVVDGNTFEPTSIARQTKKVQRFIGAKPTSQAAQTWIAGELQKKSEDTLREWVSEALKEAVEYRELDSPLTYSRSSNVKRLALCDTEVDQPGGRRDRYFTEFQDMEYYGSSGRRLKRPRKGKIVPGVSDVCVVGFLDFHKYGTGDDGAPMWYIDYMKVRGDKQGQRVASKLMDEFFRRYATSGSYVHFGKMMRKEIGHLKDKMAAAHPDVTVLGAVNY